VKLSTKTLASLLLVTAVAAAVPGITSKLPPSKRRRESQFDRLLQHHDRKGELRAAILGISPLVFKNMQKQLSLDDIVRRCGFKNVRAFRVALFGKLKDELHKRGWSPRRIERHVLSRSDRLG
jgi:hypothetical protein